MWVSFCWQTSHLHRWQRVVMYSEEGHLPRDSGLLWFQCWAGNTCHCPVWWGLCSLERQHKCGLGPVFINCSLITVQSAEMLSSWPACWHLDPCPHPALGAPLVAVWTLPSLLPIPGLGQPLRHGPVSSLFLTEGFGQGMTPCGCWVYCCFCLFPSGCPSQPIQLLWLREFENLLFSSCHGSVSTMMTPAISTYRDFRKLSNMTWKCSEPSLEALGLLLDCLCLFIKV